MAIKYLLVVNMQGQTRVAKYCDHTFSGEERRVLEGEVVRKCLTRTERQCNFFSHRDVKVVYRRYASLYFIDGIDGTDENELCMMEMIHFIVESLDKHFGNVCELDILFHLDEVHSIVDEVIANGYMVEANKANVLEPIRVMRKAMAGSGKDGSDQ